jgi:hypothetical protein
MTSDNQLISVYIIETMRTQTLFTIEHIHMNDHKQPLTIQLSVHLHYPSKPFNNQQSVNSYHYCKLNIRPDNSPYRLYKPPSVSPVISLRKRAIFNSQSLIIRGNRKPDATSTPIMTNSVMIKPNKTGE